MNVRLCLEGCGNLSTRRNFGIEVDLCEVCDGIWLDRGEFDALVAPRFSIDDVEHFFAEAARPTGRAHPIYCPVESEPLLVVEFENLELDWCPRCHGVWVDGHDREAIRRRTSAARESSGARQDASKSLNFEEAELDLPPDQQPLAERVECAACGMVVPRVNAMSRLDAYWCERCVVRGDFPGSGGPPVGSRAAEAALEMALSKTRLEARKKANRATRLMKTRVRGFVTDPVDIDGIGAAVESAAFALRSLASRFKNST